MNTYSLSITGSLNSEVGIASVVKAMVRRCEELRLGHHEVGSSMSMWSHNPMTGERMSCAFQGILVSFSKKRPYDYLPVLFNSAGTLDETVEISACSAEEREMLDSLVAEIRHYASDLRTAVVTTETCARPYWEASREALDA